MKARVGDWFVFRVADGRFAAVRIGSVGRERRIYVGWFFGPLDSPPRGEELLAKTPEEAVWPARFYDLEGDSGIWEKVVAGEPGAPLWPVEHFGVGGDGGPWFCESYGPDDPSKRLGSEHVDRERFVALPSGIRPAVGDAPARCDPARDPADRSRERAVVAEVPADRLLRRRDVDVTTKLAFDIPE